MLYLTFALLNLLQCPALTVSFLGNVAGCYWGTPTSLFLEAPLKKCVVMLDDGLFSVSSNLLYLVIYLLYVKFADSSSSHGNSFVLSFPKLDKPEVILFFQSFQPSPFEITLFSKKSAGITLIDSLPPATTIWPPYYLDVSHLIVMEYEGVSLQGVVIVNASFKFGLQVHIFENNTFAGSFMALPVHQWGRRYLVATLMWEPFIIIITETITNVLIFFEAYVPLHGKVFKGRWAFNRSLEQYEALVISKCDRKRSGHNVTLTGTIVESTAPIGVISGNCRSHFLLETCNVATVDLNRDFSIEMMLPHKLFGLEFITLSHPWARNRNTQNDVTMVVTSRSHTNVTVYLTQDRNTTYVINSFRRILYINTTRGSLSFLLRSNKPIMVIHIETSTCSDHGSSGGPSLTWLIPNEMFYNEYIWMMSKNISSLRHIVIIVIAKGSLLNMENGNRSLVHRRGVMGVSTPYEILHYVMTVDYVTFSSSVRFGCYSYGLGTADGVGSYVTYAGYHFNSSSQADECLSTLQYFDDLVDNDCDGLVDEETDNGVDDDGDGFIDEDMMYLPPNYRDTSPIWILLALLSIILILIVLMLMTVFKPVVDEKNSPAEGQKRKYSFVLKERSRSDLEVPRVIELASERSGSNVDTPDIFRQAYHGNDRDKAGNDYLLLFTAQSQALEKTLGSQEESDKGCEALFLRKDEHITGILRETAESTGYRERESHVNGETSVDNRFHDKRESRGHRHVMFSIPEEQETGMTDLDTATRIKQMQDARVSVEAPDETCDPQSDTEGASTILKQSESHFHPGDILCGAPDKGLRKSFNYHDVNDGGASKWDSW